ncbi:MULTISPECIES: hypothetical protein [unclassified Enterococcus]|uniref:hypothetical protein n=1 Tax=unclassified Enterococcus TaxID=2608891 RepID=UPI00155704A7|nr:MULTISPECIES: hypothetical protein [unclassified Enterococcus]MBS7576964.1 hypothetical protein [Enterococcus sp. MMGLQ5-2]MBS7584371.1 hypothetical protein [Enterococcus sp. MMGLQ5-1]NPD12226.1 hypothetical protein [Enterococcus sp. MMGLQ5-1]NPD36798.1 hypothetical protein [Enterococcus sp. MMGLQ5-2]
MTNYTVEEVCEIISPDLKLRTLYDWIRKIENQTQFRFTKKINMANPYYVRGQPQKVYLLDDVEIDLLARLYTFRINGENLTKAIDSIFLLEDDFNRKYPVEDRL